MTQNSISLVFLICIFLLFSLKEQLLDVNLHLFVYYLQNFLSIFTYDTCLLILNFKEVFACYK